MSVLNFCSETLSSERLGYIDTGSEQKRAYTPVYTDIPCDFYNTSGSARPSEGFSPDNKEKSKIIVPAEYPDFLQGDRITVNGLKYEVDTDPKKKKFVSGITSHLEMTVYLI